MRMNRFAKMFALTVLCVGFANCGGGGSSGFTGGNPPPSGTPSPVTVNWNAPEQTIDGFGAWTADSIQALPTNLADFFFTTSPGIGLSILGTQIMPTLADCQSWMTSLRAPKSDCVTVSSGATSIVGEPLVAQQAVARSLTMVISASWSPPASMKSNGVFYQGGNFVGNATNYTSYAALLASYPAFMGGYGVPIYAINMQEEPDISQTYPSALWTAQQFHDFIPYLHSAIAASANPSTKIFFPQNSAWSSSYAGFAVTTMNDSSVAPYVGFLAQDGFAGDSNIVAATNYGTHVWLAADASQSSTYDGSMTNALAAAQVIHNYLTVANVNAYMWWFLSDIPGQGNGTDNSALTDVNGNIPLRAYITGNWSKFVRPGWNRVGVTNSGSLLVSAFEGPTGGTAIVVVNSGAAVNNQLFNVGTTMGMSVVPWVTSSTQNLQSQANVSVSSGSFTYTIPANSVVTFAAI